MRFSLPAILLIAACGSGPGQAGTLVQPAQAAESPVRLSGSREEQLAQVLAAIVPVSASRDWAAAQAAFPGARWEERTSDTAPTVVEGGITDGSQPEPPSDTDALGGSIDLNGDRFAINIYGSPERVTMIGLRPPDGTLVSRAALFRALAARGVGWRLLRCEPISYIIGVTIVELTVGGQSAILTAFFSGEGSDYVFRFDEGFGPADPPGNCPDIEVRDLR